MINIPDTKVRIAFDLSAGGAGNYFTLDDTNKGVLSGGTVTSVYPLAGEFLEDVTQFVKKVSIKRGRSQELQNTSTGLATVVLDNRARTFDPTAGTAVSPYNQQIVPRKQITISSNGVKQFDGVIEDWDLTYSLDGMSETVAKAADGFSQLARQVITPHTATPQTSGERIEAILDRPEIDWPSGKRDIATGYADLIGEAVGGTANPKNVNAMDYLRKIETDEAGLLFVGKNGSIIFRDRLDLQRTTSTVFADDSSGIPFNDIQVLYGTELLRNRVDIALLNAGTVTEQFTESQADYGVVSYDISESLLDGEAEATDLAQWLLTLYGVPRVRFDALGVSMNALTLDQQNTVLGLELGDLVTVRFTPNGVGDAIVQSAVIESIDHDVTVDKHQITFGLAFSLSTFILDSPTFGVLDQNTLGF